MCLVVSLCYFIFLKTDAAMRFDVPSKVLFEPFPLSTPLGDSVVSKRIYRRCHITSSHKVTFIYLIKLDILEFDVILGSH